MTTIPLPVDAATTADDAADYLVRMHREGCIDLHAHAALSAFVREFFGGFERDGMDLHCEMPISFATAALGGEIEIPTLDGAAKLRIPAETQSGQVFRLRGKGIKALRASQHGDLMCHVQVETPVKLTDRQKELLREFDAISQGAPAKHNPKAQSFMDKLKDFFGG